MKIKQLFTVSLVFLSTFVYGVAYAFGGEAGAVDPVKELSNLFLALKGEQWRLASGSVLMLLVFGLRRARNLDFLKSRRAGVITAMALSLVAHLAPAILSDMSVQDAIISAVIDAVLAMGTYSGIRAMLKGGQSSSK